MPLLGSDVTFVVGGNAVFADLMAVAFGTPKVAQAIFFFQLTCVNTIFIVYVALNVNFISPSTSRAMGAV